MEENKKSALLGAGAVLAAFGASLCCILPVAVAVLGVGSAALAATLEPLRPWLAGVTLLLLGVAFYQAHKPEDCASAGQACAVPSSRRRARVLLYLVAAVAVALMAFPYYASWLF